MRLIGFAARANRYIQSTNRHATVVISLSLLNGQLSQQEVPFSTIPFRSSSDSMDTALSLFTGDKTAEFNGGYDDDATITIIQDLPLPMTILAIFPTLSVFDK